MTPSAVIVQVALDWECFAVAVHVWGGPAFTVAVTATLGDGVKLNWAETGVGAVFAALVKAL